MVAIVLELYSESRVMTVGGGGATTGQPSQSLQYALKYLQQNDICFVTVALEKQLNAVKFGFRLGWKIKLLLSNFMRGNLTVMTFLQELS